jgi:ABC-2 type transport system permease protein
VFERIKAILRKECIQVLRDPRMKGIVFVMPVFQVLVFGYAITTDVRHVETAVYDLDNSIRSRDLVAAFVRSGYFDVASYVTDDAAAGVLIDRGDVSLVLRMNKGFQETLDAGRTAQVQLIVDGSDSNTARIVLAYSATIAQSYSNSILTSHLLRRGGGLPPLPGVDLVTRAWFNENLESRNFYVPGVIATLVSLVTLMLTSMAVVREKEIGTMEQIIVTPITPAEFILGKTVPFAIIALIDVVLVTVIGVFWFDIPIRGNLLWLFVSVVLYVMTTLGVGLLISTVCSTQQQAMMSTFFFFFPAMLLSGFLFPIANMPTVIQWLTLANPLRYFLVIIRGIFLKGVGPEVLWTQMLALAIIGVATLFLAAGRFHKTLA